ncbi:hypothetical protein EVAR_75378_1 [Eumeta japonica]|uniref:Uncharacterized protein n=1 Tax=Eumeta variegata TaxID=151549 RepID=A0A4C1Y9Y7_EUMVA|nr:hypothetical protein EVAR_75378_1 [Eumeta japonica]
MQRRLSGATRPSRATRDRPPRPPLCGRSDDKTGCTLVKLKPGLTVVSAGAHTSDIRDPMATPRRRRRDSLMNDLCGLNEAELYRML